MAASDDRREWFSVGRVFSRAFDTLRGIPTVVLLIVGGFSALPDVLLTLVLMAIGPGPLGFISMISGIIANVLAVVGQAALMHAVLRYQQGKAVNLGDSVGAAGEMIIPIIGLNILWGLGVGIGIVLLILPGLYLMTIWSVAMPARVADGPGVIAALTESNALTKGVRLKVFALTMILAVIVAGVILGLYGAQRSAADDTPWIIGLIVSPLSQAFLTAVTVLGSSSLFHELRWGPGQGGASAVASVFD